jgi:CBS domain-containing protein
MDRTSRRVFGSEPYRAQYGQEDRDYERVWNRGDDYRDIIGRDRDYRMSNLDVNREDQWREGRTFGDRFSGRDEGRPSFRRDRDFDRGLAGRIGQERWDIGARRSRWQREPLAARDIMTRNVKGVMRDTTLREAAQVMKDENCGIVPVVDQNMRLLGVLTDRDIVMRTLRDDRPLGQVRVSEVMTDEVECVTADERLTDVIDLMGHRQIRRVPVVDREDRLVGIISMGDIATRADYDEDLQDSLERISSRRSFWSRIFG